MTDLATGWIGLLADWSVRWSVLIFGLILLFSARPPRAVATRLWLARLVLIGGLLLPLTPQWWAVPVPRPAASNHELADQAIALSTADSAINQSTHARIRFEPQPGRGEAGSESDSVAATNHESPKDENTKGWETGSGSDSVATSALVALPEGEPITSVATQTESLSPTTSRFDWPLILSVAWLAGCGFCLCRLIAGRWWLTRVRRAAVPVEEVFCNELDAVRAELGVCRPVVLLTSPAVAGPALFGGRRPAIVVPPDWSTLPASDRRATLLHELTHIHHRDDWARVAEELVRAVFFFHPLVRWLLAQLAREREHRCDAAAVRHGVPPRELAWILVTLIRRLGPGRSVLSPAAAIPMAHRNSMSERIHQLMEDDMTRWSKPLSNARATWTAVVILGLCAALGGAGLAADPIDPPPSPAPKAADPQKAPDAASVIRGSVKDKAGNAVAGATVIASRADLTGDKRTTITDASGHFAFGPDPRPAGASTLIYTNVVAVKDGFAPGVGSHLSNAPAEVVITLPDATEYEGTVKDTFGKPIAGAEVEFGTVSRSGNAASWGYVYAIQTRGTPADKYYHTITDATGAFRFTTVPVGAELIFRATASKFAVADTSFGGPKRIHVAEPGAKPANLTLQPEAVIRGQVTCKVSGVALTSLSIRAQGTGNLHGLSPTVTPDAGGRIEFRSLPAGDYNVYLIHQPNARGVATGTAITVKAGETAEVKLDLVEGVEVTGLVRVKDTQEPLAGVTVIGTETDFPMLHDAPRVTTDATGRFRLRLPPGEAQIMLWAMPKGFAQPSNFWERRKVNVPATGGPIELPEPFEAVRVSDGLTGRVTDAAGKPLGHAKVSALQHSSVCGNFSTEPVTASFDGQFSLKYSPNGPLEVGRSVPLRVVTSDGQTFETSALLPKTGVAEIRVPTLPGIAGPQDVKPEEFAGVVVDETGKPLPGVKVHVWDWVDRPENYTFTGPDGVFRLKDCGRNKQIQVRFRKDGYSPVMMTHQPVGVKGLVIALDKATYFEGVVRGPDGKPVADAVIRADQGMKVLDGGIATQNWTQTTTGPDGRYRLYVQPDEYEFHVKAAKIGVARLPKTGIGHGDKRTLDIALQAGITFRARVVDSVTGRPAPGLRLHDWQEKSVDGTSDARGEITITDLLPGEFQFSVESNAYARWWSDDTAHDYERKRIDDPKTGWQRNFDRLTFVLKPGMEPVTITAEPVVRVTGRVVDPDGKPVGGATVAPARTGSGNSLTGDTRFSVKTKPDGTFIMTLPASGAARYNLVCHDGDYQEWRKWANGILPPITTTPGQVIDGVTLALTRPGVLRGKVVDAKGRPVAGREVFAQSTDKFENRYYDPTTQTKADGTFELKFLRPTEHLVRVAPYWVDGVEPPGSTRTLIFKPGEVVENLTLVAGEEPAK